MDYFSFVSGGTVYRVSGLRGGSSEEQRYISSLLLRNKTSPMMPVVTVTEDDPSPALGAEDVCGDPTILDWNTLRDEECASLSSPVESEIAAPEAIPEAATPESIPEAGTVEPVTPGDIYSELYFPDPDAVTKHTNFLVNLFEHGAYPYPLESIDPDSPTPYTDLAKPRKKGPAGVIKRPMNAFLAFAQGERQRFIEARAQLGNAQISTHLGQVWHALPDRMKEPFSRRTQFLKELHQMEFPQYKYKPQKKKGAGAPAKAEKPTTSRRRVRKKKSVTEETEQEMEQTAVVAVTMEELQSLRSPSSQVLGLDILASLPEHTTVEPAALSPALSTTSTIPSPPLRPPSAELQPLQDPSQSRVPPVFMQVESPELFPPMDSKELFPAVESSQEVFPPMETQEVFQPMESQELFPSELMMPMNRSDFFRFAHSLPFQEGYEADERNWEKVTFPVMDNLIEDVPDFL